MLKTQGRCCTRIVCGAHTVKKITYPGTNNYTNFTFDALGRCVKIVETTAGSVTSTKQFVWCANQRCEVRDASGNVTAQFFANGETINGTTYYFSKDQLGSIREMTNSSGTVVWEQSFDPYGVPTTLVSTTPADMGYAGYYLHSRSGLNLTWFRQYSASLGRWLTRDPIEEETGTNLYAYAGNNPVQNTDALGLAWGPAEWKTDALKHCIVSCQLAKILGKGAAKAIGDAWEDYGNSRGQTKASAQMDLNNNAVGRKGPFRQNCGDYCRQQYEDGRLFGPYGPLVPPNPGGGVPWSPPPPDPPKPSYCPGPNSTPYNGGNGDPPDKGVRNYPHYGLA